MGKTTIPSKADSVVEVGTSGIWTYRKWSSGIAECWGKYTATISHYYSTGNGWFAYQTGSISLPSNLFISNPLLVLADGYIGNGFYIGTRVSVATTTAVDLIGLGSASGSQSCIFFICVKGTWK